MRGSISHSAASCRRNGQMEVCSTPNILQTSISGTEVLFKDTVALRTSGRSSHVEFNRTVGRDTKCAYSESISRHSLSRLSRTWLRYILRRHYVPSILTSRKLAHSHHIPLVVDNTLGMRYLFRPIDYGADIIVQSATKWIGGHGMSIADTAITMYPQGIFCQSSFSMSWSLDPFFCCKGAETLSLRAERQCENAIQLANFPDAHPKIGWVLYLGLESHVTHLRAKSMGGAEASKIIQNNPRLASHLANIGDAKTLVIQPAATTHLVSVGIEAIIADFEGALKIL
ncbi:PLP-dependent transferase [Guyanagaster necrorhizus]|uniref:PLP-dependent transferase n=1 Tax=Guyanagaster necrorhizus TaxID=856835 RepID=A0A9P7VKA2_9AGAR|nr:PLP-dependent transferase [Guyanagaster necrorhizus MCA 3950]KAG7441479.1 PLP-dependent transferase [Guyanagaster necrorhizus MCA 3950]